MHGHAIACAGCYDVQHQHAVSSATEQHARSVAMHVQSHRTPVAGPSLICRPCRTTKLFRTNLRRQVTRNSLTCRNSRLTSVCATRTIQSNDTETSKSIRVLHEAADTRAIRPKDVFDAMRQLEKQKLSPDSWAEDLAAPGRRWQLIFTTGTQQVQKAMKGGEGGGIYFPIIAAQKWAGGDEKELDSGIYLGHIASFSFQGPWYMKSRKLNFDFNRVNVKLGPWKFGFNIKAGQLGTKAPPKEGEKEKDGPYYLWVHVDDKVCVARGRSGGLAMWARTSPVWEVKAGLAQA